MELEGSQQSSLLQKEDVRGVKGDIGQGMDMEKDKETVLKTQHGLYELMVMPLDCPTHLIRS